MVGDVWYAVVFGDGAQLIQTNGWTGEEMVDDVGVVVVGECLVCFSVSIVSLSVIGIFNVLTGGQRIVPVWGGRVVRSGRCR